MTILEAQWNCSHCGKKGIPGHFTKCPECGDPNDSSYNPEEDYYLPDDARVVTDSDEIARAMSGPNWTCGHCGEMNVASDDNCVNCGEPRDNDDQEHQVVEYVDGVAEEGAEISDKEDLQKDWADAMWRGESPEQVLADEPVKRPKRTLHMDDLPDDAPDSPYPDVDESADEKVKRSFNFAALFSKLNKRLVVIIIAAIAALALLIGGGVWIYKTYIATHTVDLTVQSTSWDRQVEVEEYRTLHQDGWTYPGDARIISRSTRIKGYVRVLDHYETKYRTVYDRVRSGSHQESYTCGHRKVNMGNGYYSSEDIKCSRTVDDYKNVSRRESYQDPVYRNDPVYAPWYTYDIDRWVTDHWNEAKGSEKPYWPDPILYNSKQRIGDERKEVYQISLVDTEGRNFTTDVPNLATWSSLHVGMKLQGEENHQGSLRSVHWPAA